MVHFDIEKLDNLPSKQPLNHSWKRRKYDSTFGKRNPYFTAIKILDNNIGKSFDLAYSYYCKNTRKENRDVFLSYVHPKDCQMYSYEYYIIDENGLIQYSEYYHKHKINERKRKFISNDAEFKTVHIGSGIEKKFFEPLKIILGYKEVFEYFYERTNKWKSIKKQRFVKKPIEKQIGWIYKKTEKGKILPQYEHIIAKDEDFVLKLTKGISLTFDSPKDPMLLKLKKDKYKAYKIEQKNRKKNNTIDYDFILKQGTERLIKQNDDKLLSEKQMKEKLKLENDIKIISHGFDLETSFRTVISWKKKKKKTELEVL